MRKFVLIVAFVICAATSFAGLVTVINVNPGNSYVGQINVTLTNVLGLNGNVGTFCVETGEHIGLGGQYNADISTAAVKGGTGSSDPLDPKTAWLFWQYWTGAIVLDTNDKAAGFQFAVWSLEEETYTRSMTAGETTYRDQYLGQANASTWTDIGPVRVMNLGYSPDYTNQDLLIPEPATICLLGLGLGALGLLRRKHSKA